METNETLKTALWHQTEMELQPIMERVQALAEGDLKGLEEQVDGKSAQQSAEERTACEAVGHVLDSSWTRCRLGFTRGAPQWDL